MKTQPDAPRTLARDTEQRLTDDIFNALAPHLGEETARRMIEERELERPPPQVEGPVAKLHRLQESIPGRKWLRENPDATWDEIEAVRL